ncbi:hypothetical protein HY251_21530 [bacterium]|nr:hypothetical protein [bacterium]
MAVDQLARKVAAGELDLDPDDQFRILDARRRALAMGDEETRTIAEAVAEVDAEGRSSPELLVGLRAAANLLASHESDVPYSPPRGRRNGFASPVRQVRELGREIEERLTAGEEDAP